MAAPGSIRSAFALAVLLMISGVECFYEESYRPYQYEHALSRREMKDPFNKEERIYGKAKTTPDTSTISSPIYTDDPTNNKIRFLGSKNKRELIDCNDLVRLDASRLVLIKWMSEQLFHQDN